MSPAERERLDLALNGDELAVFTELLEAERNKLMVEIRHTAHRSYRDDLRHRLETVENLIGRCRPTS